MVGYPQHVTLAQKMRQFKNALFHRIRPSRKNVHPHEVKVTLNTRLDLRLRVWPKNLEHAKILISPGFRFRKLPKHVCVLGKLTPQKCP